MDILFSLSAYQATCLALMALPLAYLGAVKIEDFLS